MSSLSKIELSASFKFKESDDITPTNKAACLAIILRDDLNLKTFSFDPLKTTPSAEIFVCPFWSGPKPGPLEKIVRTLDKKYFGMFVARGNWTTYTFISTINYQ